MHTVYILKSKKTGRHYIGCTSDIQKRVEIHNAGYNESTKKDRPWEVIGYRNFERQEDAYKEEKLIKSYKGGNGFKKIISGDVSEWSIVPLC